MKLPSELSLCPIPVPKSNSNRHYNNYFGELHGTPKGVCKKKYAYSLKCDLRNMEINACQEQQQSSQHFQAITLGPGTIPNASIKDQTPVSMYTLDESLWAGCTVWSLESGHLGFCLFPMRDIGQVIKLLEISVISSVN